MTREAQRVAIGIACGWKCAGYPDQILATKGWQFAYQFFINPTGDIVSHNSIPDYLNDLNAMHEAEKMLTYEQNEQFVFWLNHIHPSADIHTAEKKRDLRLDVFDLCHSPASQRAEAFLRTLGLWQETPTQPQ